MKQLILFSAAIALFWNIDTGAYVNIATFAALTYFEFQPTAGTLFRNAKNIILLGLNQLVYILFVFGAITVGNYIFFNAWPDWGLELADISTFNSGYGKVLLPLYGLFEVYVFVYLGFLAWIAKKLTQGEKVNPIIMFFSVFGAFSLMYYVGNSVWSYLNFVAIPALVLVWYALYKSLKTPGVIIGQRLTNALIYSLLAFAITMSAAKIPTVFAYRDYTNISLHLVAPEKQELYEDALYIKENFSQTRIPLFHEFDGSLLVWAGKINSLYLQDGDRRLYSLYSAFLVIYKRHTAGLITQIEESWPEHVFISSDPDQRIQDFETFVKQHYILETELNTVNIYKLK